MVMSNRSSRNHSLFCCGDRLRSWIVDGFFCR